jgi:hypothetical protein
MSTSNPQPQKEEHLTFLRSLLNKNLRVTTTDGRMFWGTFKCTDAVSFYPALHQQQLNDTNS